MVISGEGLGVRGEGFSPCEELRVRGEVVSRCEA